MGVVEGIGRFGFRTSTDLGARSGRRMKAPRTRTFVQASDCAPGADGPRVLSSRGDSGIEALAAQAAAGRKETRVWGRAEGPLGLLGRWGLSSGGLGRGCVRAAQVSGQARPELQVTTWKKSVGLCKGRTPQIFPADGLDLLPARLQAAGPSQIPPDLGAARPPAAQDTSHHPRERTRHSEGR